MSSPNTQIDFCPYCKNEIDATVCWCGDYRKNHTYEHSFVPMGCTCGYITEREEKYVLKTLAEKYPETHNKT